MGVKCRGVCGGREGMLFPTCVGCIMFQMLGSHYSYACHSIEFPLYWLYTRRCMFSMVSINCPLFL
jgi:hypothetical protein